MACYRINFYLICIISAWIQYFEIFIPNAYLFLQLINLFTRKVERWRSTCIFCWESRAAVSRVLFRMDSGYNGDQLCCADSGRSVRACALGILLFWDALPSILHDNSNRLCSSASDSTPRFTIARTQTSERAPQAVYHSQFLFGIHYGRRLRRCCLRRPSAKQ